MGEKSLTCSIELEESTTTVHLQMKIMWYDRKLQNGQLMDPGERFEKWQITSVWHHQLCYCETLQPSAPS